MATNKPRRSGIELLRILAMLLIVAHHFALHTNWPAGGSAYNSYLIEVLKSFGKVGAGIFFIIAGYFLTKRKNDSSTIRRIFKIARPTWFYALACLVFILAIGDFTIVVSLPVQREIYNSFLPITGDAYWFVGAYIVLELISPYLIKMINAITNKEALTLLFMYIVISWEFGSLSFLATGDYTPITTIPSCIIYSAIGILIARSEKDISKSKSLICIALCFLALIVAPALMMRMSGYPYNGSLAWQFDSPICMLLAGSLFVVFSRMNFTNKIINYVFSTMFGVYLIHDNIFIRRWLWQGGGIIQNAAHFSDPPISFAIYSAAAILAVFSSCILIEIIRKTITAIVFWFYKMVKTIFSRKSTCY